MEPELWLPARLKEHFADEPPETLYHYTSAAGLMGIIDLGGLWATQLQYMNDSKEAARCVEMLRTHWSENVEPEVTKAIEEKVGTTSDEYKGFLEALSAAREEIMGALDGVEDFPIFAACLCEDGDLLSQWRGYGASGSGYSIEFRTDRIKTCCSRLGLLFGKCIYDRDIQSVIVDQLTDYFISHSKEDWSGFSQALVVCSAFFKDKYFEEEAEWRMVSIRGAAEKFRPGRSSLIPYKEFQFRNAQASRAIDGPIFKSVCVGPNAHSGLARNALLSMLANKQAAEGWSYRDGRVLVPNVTTSKSSFRNW